MNKYGSTFECNIVINHDKYTEKISQSTTIRGDNTMLHLTAIISILQHLHQVNKNVDWKNIESQIVKYISLHK